MVVASGAVVLTVPNLSGAECEFSRISGITCIDESKRSHGGFSVSSWLKLDFTTSSQSFLFTSKACPFGVSDCFNEEAETHMKRLRIGDLAIDPSTTGPFQFTLVSVVDPELLLEDGGFRNRVLRSRDVHGSVAFGPNSPIFQNAMGLAVSEVDGNDPKKNLPFLRFFSDVNRESASDSFFVPVQNPESNEDWEVLGHLQVNGIAINESSSSPIRIDPGADEIIIPIALLGIFIENMKGFVVQRIVNGRPYVDCTKEHVPRLSFKFGDDGKVLKIKRIQLLTSNLTSSVCALRIYFSKTATSITVGRALVRSLEKVILDASGDKRVGFTRRRSAAKLGPILDRELRSPSFVCDPRSVSKSREQLSLLGRSLWYGNAFILLNSEFNRDSQIQTAQCVYLFNPLGQELTLPRSEGVRYEIARGLGWPDFTVRHESASGWGIRDVFYTFNRANKENKDPVSFWLKIYQDSHAKICIEPITSEQEGTARESDISLVPSGDEDTTDKESDSTDMSIPDSDPTGPRD